MDFSNIKIPSLKKIFELDFMLGRHFSVLIAEDALLFIASIVFLILTMNLKLFAVFIVVALFYLFTILNQMAVISNGNYITIDGTATCTERSIEKILWREISGKANIIIDADDGHQYILPLKGKRLPKDCKVRVYAILDSIYEKDDDTFTIPDPIYIKKIKN